MKPPTDPPRGRHGWRSGYWLVLALIVVSYALGVSQTSPQASMLTFLVQLVAVAMTLQVAAVGRRVRRVSGVVLSIAGLAALAVTLTGVEGHIVDLLLSAASVTAYLVAPIAIIAHQLRRADVDGETLLAAIAAYVMVGMFFAFAYDLIAVITDVPTFGVDEVDSLANQLFFSFTTLTTTGYGNLVPSEPLVQSVAVAETIIGQLFLVVAVARVVSGWTPSRRASAQG